MNDKQQAAMESLASDPNSAHVMLDSLRWKPDTRITNHEGERVWLKQTKHGIEDCCFEDVPCERHARMAMREHGFVEHDEDYCI